MKPSRINGMISFFSIGEKSEGLIRRISKKITQAVASRSIVRLIGLNSCKPSLINGKANAQKIKGIKITKYSYFFEYVCT